MITGKIDQTMKVENNLMNRQEIDLQMISDGVKQEIVHIAIRLFFVCIANQAPTKLFPIVQAPVKTHYSIIARETETVLQVRLSRNFCCA